MVIEDVEIGKLNPAEYNPREISEEEFEGLKKSLQTFGFVDPVIVNKRNMVIVGGHMRTRAAEELGMTTVPVTFVDLDDAMEKALNVALNSGAISGKYDNEKLRPLLDELKLTIDSEVYDGLRLTVIEPPVIKVVAPVDYGSKNVEFNASEFGGDLKHSCPKCGFEFGE